MSDSNVDLAKSIHHTVLGSFFVGAILLAYVGVLPSARAIMPAPDGGYPGNNTAEGTDALFNLTSGAGNTGIGFDALFSNTIGFSNTAVGVNALRSNTTAGS